MLVLLVVCGSGAGMAQEIEEEQGLRSTIEAESETEPRMSLREQILTRSDDDFLAQEFSRNVYMSLLQRNASYYVNGVQVDDNCAQFITPQAELGEHGRYIVDHIESEAAGYATLLSGRGMNVCGRYTQLSTRQKGIIWALVLTTMAHFESNCRVSAGNSGAPNGTAKGYFQLHLGHENEYPSSNNACTRNVSLNGRQSLRCALGMLDYQLQERGALFSNRSYWDVLRPNGDSVWKMRAIQRAITNSSLCRDNSI